MNSKFSKTPGRKVSHAHQYGLITITSVFQVLKEKPNIFLLNNAECVFTVLFLFILLSFFPEFSPLKKKRKKKNSKVKISTARIQQKTMD